MKRIGVVANGSKTEAPQVLKRLAVKAAASGLTLVVADKTADHLPNAEVVAAERLAAETDVLLALGGDGTMLHAVRMRGTYPTPVLGVNLGSLGFMTSVTVDDLERAVDVLIRGDYTVTKRTMLACSVESGGDTVCSYTALNDVVLGWGASSRASVLGLSINDEEVSSYLCDGLIVSTPTGSTGHSLSAWGPIIHPQSPVLLVNVICPHTLSARPLVLPDDSQIAVEVTRAPEHKRLLLSADGQGEWPLKQGDVVRVACLAEPVTFLHLPEYRYFSMLRQKLHWRGSARN